MLEHASPLASKPRPSSSGSSSQTDSLASDDSYQMKCSYQGEIKKHEK